MKKLNDVIYNKLLLQAEEAKETGFDKLASNIVSAIGSFPAESFEVYSFNELSDNIEQDLWKAATNVLRYYNIDSVDAVKLNEIITLASKSFHNAIVVGADIDSDKLGPFEPKVPGEK